MKKTNLLKVFFSLILSIVVIFIVTSVNAADTGFTDMTNSLLNNTSGFNNTIGNNVNAPANNTTGTNTSNNALGNSSSTNNRTNVNSNISNTNTRIYNNTSLPSTGIGDSLPIAALVVVFGISAVYAYKKIKDYRNI